MAEVDRDGAVAIAKRHLTEMQADSGLDGQLALLTSETEEHDFGWVFFYNSSRFLQTGDFSYALVGNAPLLVERDTGRLLTLGTALPTEDYLDVYRVTGDPHGEVDHLVLVDGLPDGISTSEATLTLRRVLDLPMAQARNIALQLEGNETLTLRFDQSTDASELTERLRDEGFPFRMRRGPRDEPAA